MRIYVTSKTKHAPMWKALRANGAPIIASWLDETGPGQTADWAEFWRRAAREIADSDAMIVYREEGEALRGAYVEIGMAFASDVQVWWIGPACGGSPSRGSSVRFASTVEDALQEIGLVHREYIRSCLGPLAD